MAVTASEARARLFPLIEQVNDDQAAVEITSKRGTAYLVSEQEYLSLRETVYLVRSPVNAARLRASLAEARAGNARPRDLIDPGVSAPELNGEAVPAAPAASDATSGGLGQRKA